MFDLEPTTRIAICAVVWGAVLLAVLKSLSTRGYATVGITFAFFGCYTSFHGGALVYLTEGYDPTQDPYLASFHHTPATVALGLEASTLAMLSALLGCKLADSFWGAKSIGHIEPRPHLSVLKNAAVLLICVGTLGITFDVVFSSVSSALPGFQAIISCCRNLFVVGGTMLVWHQALAGKQRNAYLLAAFFAIAIPVIILMRTSILGDSIFFSLLVFSFLLFVRARQSQRAFVPNLSLFAGLALASFVFAAAYLELRDELRATLWSGGTFTEAVDTMSKSGSADVSSATGSSMKTLYAIDSRLNQNLFVGLAIQQLEALPDTYEDGATIALALFGWVPRVFWPGKPERGGAVMISKHTGKQTDGTTSFGAGAVFEFYVNYGYTAVVIGFIVLGFLVRMVDASACRALLSLRIAPYAMYALIGGALIHPGADLFFIVSSIAASIVLSVILAQPIAYVTALRPASARERPAQVPNGARHERNTPGSGAVTRIGE